MREFKTRKKAKRKILIESLFVFFIAISPFLFKLYDYLPEDPEATISFFGIIIDNNGFHDIILIPIAMYSFQLFEVIFDSDDYVDTENIWWLIPICMVVIPFVYLIRIKLYDKYVHGIDMEAMDAELKTIKTHMGESGSSSNTDKELEKENAVQPEIGYQSLSEYLNTAFSTDNIERKFRDFQNNLKSWLHLKF